MKPELKQAWIDDLESGKHEQCRQVLFDGTGYCCLGRLAEVAGATFVKEIDDETGAETGDYVPTPIDGTTINDGVILLSDEALDMFGLTGKQMIRLSRLNDGERGRRDYNGKPLPDLPPMTFREIAQVIKEEM